MKLGLMLGYSGAELRIPLEDVKLAEQLGYDSVWTAEAYGSDAITPLAYIAAHTDRIRLGTADVITGEIRKNYSNNSPPQADAVVPYFSYALITFAPVRQR